MQTPNNKVTVKQFRRFPPLYSTLHILMILSFMSLALTGMTLKFSYTQWAVIMAHVFGGFESAGHIHRTAAVVMIGLFIAHLFDLCLKKRASGLSWIKFIFHENSLMFLPKDFYDFVASIKWFLGCGPRPAYSRWTYWEKFDYFAVFWGIAIIGSTGAMLWFPELFTRFLPGWLINVATIVHSDEALLATGFIFTIHFFNTHLRPEKFPMDIVIFTGRMPVEEYKFDKLADYNKLVQTGELEKYLDEPPPKGTVKAARIFGGIMVAIGFSIVIWIIYAMVFAYR